MHMGCAMRGFGGSAAFSITQLLNYQITKLPNYQFTMPRQSEALILRTWPFHEADLLVTFFTRSEGKVRGVAKAAKRSKRRFGGALEPLTHVTDHWEEKEKQELVR